MSSFSRLLDIASKALDKGNSSSPHSQSGGRDWRSMLRDVAAPGVGLTPPPSGAPRGAGAAATPPHADAADRSAIARYEYLLKTADPHQVEQIHREAFARLTPQQRAQVQSGMRSELRDSEQPRSAEANDLARAAARSEAIRPGVMAGLLARAGRGGGGRTAALMGVGGVLGAVAGGAVVSAVAAPMLAQAAGMGVDFDALASGIDLESLASGVDLGGAGDFVGTAGENLGGAGDLVSGLGDQLSNFEIPGLGDFFGR